MEKQKNPVLQNRRKKRQKYYYEGFGEGYKEGQVETSD